MFQVFGSCSVNEGNFSRLQSGTAYFCGQGDVREIKFTALRTGEKENVCGLKVFTNMYGKW